MNCNATPFSKKVVACCVVNKHNILYFANNGNPYLIANRTKTTSEMLKLKNLI